MTTQPTGAAELPEALRLAEILEGDYCPDWFYEQGVDEVSKELRLQHALLNEQQRTIEALNACINGEGSTTTENLRLVDRLHAQVEALRAQPAGAQVPEAVLQAIRAAGMHLIRGMNDVYSLIPAMNATAQPAGAATPAAPAQLRQEGELLQLARAYKEYIDALPADVVAALPAMPGVDGDWADEVLDRAARAAPQPANPWLRALEIRMAQGWNLKGDRIPVLYTDTINGDGVGRDDLWLCTTSALAAPQPAVTAETVDALVIAEAALADIGDADREPGDDVAWCEARAAQALPMVRAALAAQRGGAA